jgi:hypothetical protein
MFFNNKHCSDAYERHRVLYRFLHTLPHLDGSLHTQGNEDNKMSYSMLEKLKKTSGMKTTTLITHTHGMARNVV